VVYMTTPAVPSCFVAFFSDPYSHFEIFNFYYTSTYIRPPILRSSAYSMSHAERRTGRGIDIGCMLIKQKSISVLHCKRRTTVLVVAQIISLTTFYLQLYVKVLPTLDD